MRKTFLGMDRFDWTGIGIIMVICFGFCAYQISKVSDPVGIALKNLGFDKKDPELYIPKQGSVLSTLSSDMYESQLEKKPTQLTTSITRAIQPPPPQTVVNKEKHLTTSYSPAMTKNDTLSTVKILTETPKKTPKRKLILQ
ncbi:MAG: hypothetical protein Q8P77_02620 [Candidatus Veblenbacteria bacterium]|nr:hypothetical protein [Candidatus Veblenbacteria bacterium]